MSHRYERRDSCYERRDSRNDRDRRDSRDRRRSPAPSSSRGSPSPAPRDESELPTAFGRVSNAVEESDIDVLKRMTKNFINAPLGTLVRVLDGSKKIKIWTRNFKSVRGICTGYLVAFDKHWNITMTDCDEAYLKPKKSKQPFLDTVEEGENLAELPPKVPRQKKENTESVQVESKDDGEKTDKKKKRKKKRKSTTPRSRHVPQLFVRGDNIVMLTVLDEESEIQSILEKNCKYMM